MSKSSYNPSLKQLAMLEGEWVIELSNAAFLPDPKTTMTGSASFDWIEDGAYLVMRQGERAQDMWAIWTINRDEAASDYKVFYFDNRNVSRIYEMSFENNVWKMWRHTPEFSQRFEAKVSKDKKVLTGAWEKSYDGKKWEHDFDLVYKKK